MNRQGFFGNRSDKRRRKSGLLNCDHTGFTDRRISCRKPFWVGVLQRKSRGQRVGSRHCGQQPFFRFGSAQNRGQYLSGGMVEKRPERSFLSGLVQFPCKDGSTGGDHEALGVLLYLYLVAGLRFGDALLSGALAECGRRRAHFQETKGWRKSAAGSCRRMVSSLKSVRRQRGAGLKR
jgi:hypothetical protein